MTIKNARRARLRRLAAAKRASDWTPDPEAAGREVRRARRRRYRRHRRRVLMLILLVSGLLGLAARYFCFDLVTVRGAGMSPTLQSGDMVLCVKQSLLDQLVGIVPEDVRRVGADDLVLIRYTPGSEEAELDGGADAAPAPAGAVDAAPTLMIRRVTAMAGDTIDTGGGEMIINRDLLAGRVGDSDRVYPITVPTGRMFVTGDARDVAIDSRRRAFGLVPEADVIGRPLAVIWPAFAVGWVK